MSNWALNRLEGVTTVPFHLHWDREHFNPKLFNWFDDKGDFLGQPKDEVKTWCNESLQLWAWSLTRRDKIANFYFSSEEDALLFVLRWFSE